MLRSLEYLLLKYEDLNLIPSTHGKMSGAVACALVIPELGVGLGRQIGGCEGLLDSQSNQIHECQLQGESPSQKSKMENN